MIRVIARGPFAFALVLSIMAAGESSAANPAVWDVRQFGAVGDGKADDTAAIQRAIDQSEHGVWIGKGDYRITRTLVVDLDKVNRCSITGDGTGTLLMESAGPAIQLIGQHEGTAGPTSFQPRTWQRQRSPVISNLEIVGKHAEADGIEIRGVMQPTIRGVSVREAQDGITLVYNNRNVILTECHLFHNRGKGILLDHVNLHQILIGDCHLFGNQGGGVVVLGGNVRNLHIGNCDIEANMPTDGTVSRAANVLLDIESTQDDPMPKDPQRKNPHTNTIAEVSITGCTLQHTRKSPQGANVRIFGREGYPINSVAIGSNVMSDAHVNVDLNHARGVTLTGNHFIQSYPFDVRIRNSQQVSLSGDQFTARMLEGARGQQNGSLIESSSAITMTGVLFDGMISPEGALRVSGCQDVILSGCLLRDSARGLVLRDSSNVVITGCIASGTAEGAKALEVTDCENVRMSANLFEP